MSIDIERRALFHKELNEIGVYRPPVSYLDYDLCYRAEINGNDLILKFAFGESWVYVVHSGEAIYYMELQYLKDYKSPIDYFRLIKNKDVIIHFLESKLGEICSKINTLVAKYYYNSPCS